MLLCYYGKYHMLNFYSILPSYNEDALSYVKMQQNKKIEPSIINCVTQS